LYTPKSVREYIAETLTSVLDIFRRNDKEKAEFIIQNYIDKQAYLNTIEEKKLDYNDIWKDYVIPLRKEIYDLKNNITNLNDADDTINFKDINTK